MLFLQCRGGKMALSSLRVAQPAQTCSNVSIPKNEDALLYSRMIVIQTASAIQQSTTWFVMLA